ncbi:sterol desaturase family protein [Aquirufa beregesia]
MMQINYLAFAIPLFLGFILLEFVLSKRMGKSVHQFAESIANLNVGITERLSDLLTAGLFYWVFDWIYQHGAVLSIQENVITWILLFLFTDFIWYWYHRCGHKVNLLWGFHVVHHQSEDFNYTTSTRITLLQSIARGLFWSVLPWIGFPPHMIFTFLLIHGTYPFFTHTTLVGKLGFLEWFMVTPSHHRVHHSSNKIYLDKNFGDILIIWDRLFGTFAEETEPPVYGLTKPLKSHSFLWQHFHFLLEMGLAFIVAHTWKQRWEIVFGKPDDLDPYFREEGEQLFHIHQKTGKLSLRLQQYILWTTGLTLLILFFTILWERYLSTPQLFFLSAWVIIHVISTGAMLEKKTWVFYLEYTKMYILLGLVFFSPIYPAFLWIIVLFLAFFTWYFRPIKQWYVQVLLTV